MQKRWRLKIIPKGFEHKQTNWFLIRIFELEILGVHDHIYGSPTSGSLPLHHNILH